jgi:hypothetical protein
MMESLSELIGHAQAALSRPPLVKQIGRRSLDIEGGYSPQSGQETGSSCTSQSTCVSIHGSNDEPSRVDEEAPNRESVCEVTMCESEEGLGTTHRPHREEVP